MTRFLKYIDYKTGFGIPEYSYYLVNNGRIEQAKKDLLLKKKGFAPQNSIETINEIMN